MSTRSLPERPSLENLRKQARSLQKATRSGDPEALARVAPYTGSDRSSRADGDAHALPLQRAQLVIAREYGFPSWSALRRALEDLGEIVDRRTVRFRRELPCPIGRVWRAVSTEDGLGSWFMRTSMERRIGGRFRFEQGWAGHIGELVPERAIRFDADAGGLLRFDLEQHGTSTRFTLTDTMGDVHAAAIAPAGADPAPWHQPGGPGTHWVGVVAGYHGFVDALERWLAAGPDGPEAAPAGGDARFDLYARVLEAHHARATGDG